MIDIILRSQSQNEKITKNIWHFLGCLREMVEIEYVDHAISHNYRTRLNVAEGLSDDDVETVLLATAQEIAFEITRSCIFRIMRNAGSVLGHNTLNVQEIIEQTCRIIEKKSGIKPDWIIISPELEGLMNISMEISDRIYVRRIDKLNDLIVYSDPLFPPLQIVIGCQSGFRVEISKLMNINETSISGEINYKLINNQCYGRISIVV